MDGFVKWGRFRPASGDPEIGFDQAADLSCFSLVNDITHAIIFGQGPWSAVRTKGAANGHRGSQFFGVVERDAASARLEPGGLGQVARRQLRNRQPVGERTIRVIKARQGPTEAFCEKMIERGKLTLSVNMIDFADLGYFYKYTPPRPLEKIETDLKKIEKEIADMLAEVTE